MKVSEIIQVLDWDDRDDEYIMVLEHPSPCMDLFEFIDSKGGKITEDLARIIMQQAVKAAIESSKRRVNFREGGQLKTARLTCVESNSLQAVFILFVVLCDSSSAVLC